MAERPDRTVEVVPYSDRWPALFERERTDLASALGPVASSIEHIGSTAVPGMPAKPTIDILVVVEDMPRLLERLPALEALGYEHRPQSTLVGDGAHQFLRKVVGGTRTHHLHVVLAGSAKVQQHRRFRDALRSDPRLAGRYARLKVRLASEHADHRMRYVEEKSAWVDEALKDLGISPPR